MLLLLLAADCTPPLCHVTAGRWLQLSRVGENNPVLAGCRVQPFKGTLLRDVEGERATAG